MNEYDLAQLIFLNFNNEFLILLFLHQLNLKIIDPNNKI